MWFYENLYPDVKLGIKGELIHRKKTPYQDLRIYKTPRYGKTLVLDGAIQTTEKDEFIYHEMLTHPSLLSYPEPKEVLVIGAGDGGILREVLKHNVKKVYLVEIDDEVIRTSKKYLPSISSGAFAANGRVEIIIADGAKFIRQTKKKFDVVIVDSPDPIGVAKVLFSRKFYRDIFSILKDDGIMARQSGSTTLQLKELKENWRIMKEKFPYVSVHLAAIPTYIGGFFSFLVGSKKINQKDISYDEIMNRFKQLNLETKYYNPDIHFASTKLPTYVKGGLGE
ncbi:MAG: polyamine aminopropyltransferase [Candidatus Omnitrophota bacterium]|nr:MAG: polyamine aminopropyltransferase [Candidatus Omnitrophota bacterium]